MKLVKSADHVAFQSAYRLEVKLQELIQHIHFTGKKYTISVSVKEIPKNVTTNFKITEIYMKKSDGSTLTSLPVSDSSTGTTRTVSGEVILSEVKIMCQYKFYIYMCK